MHSNLIGTLHFHPDYDAAAILQEARRWGRQRAEAHRYIQTHANDRDPERRLRIGYVSPDFCDHVVGRNMLPLLRRHDRKSFEIFCYANVLRPDSLTAELRSGRDAWRDILAMPDDQVAAMIREDRIDILVNLALHMAGNRLLGFARKPRPCR